MESTIPASPWDNSTTIAEGVYLATIKEVTCRPYRLKTGRYIRMLFWLPHVEQYICTNFYFSPQGDQRSVKRLGRLCQLVGLVPKDVFDSPKDFIGRDVAVTIKKCLGVGVNEGTEYRDIELFLSADIVTKDGKLAV